MGHGFSQQQNHNQIINRAEQQHQYLPQNEESVHQQQFSDLKDLPPEIAIEVLSNLNATDLCLASCVWKELAEDEVLWKGLCFTKWKYASIYKHLNTNTPAVLNKKPMYKTLYLLLDEATLIFAFRPHQGIKYLIEHDILTDEPMEIAMFINGTNALLNRNVQILFEDRVNVLDEFLTLQDFSDLSLCDGLREYFNKIHPPEQRGTFLNLLVEKFASRYNESNPRCGWTKENIAVICYSLLLLSVDLYSPHVKNKMSKREFIRNNRQVLTDANADVLGDLYDDVYLNGHIVPNSCQQIKAKKHRFPFYRPYGAIFEFKPIELRLTCSC